MIVGDWQAVKLCRLRYSCQKRAWCGSLDRRLEFEGEMRWRTSTNCLSGRGHLYRSPCQPCSCLLRDSGSQTSGSRCRCRYYWLIVVWITLATLSGCSGVADTSLLLPVTSSAAATTNDTDDGSDVTSSPSSLLVRQRPTSSSHSTSVVSEFIDAVKYHNHQRSNAAASKMSDTSSMVPARRRALRVRRKYCMIFCFRSLVCACRCELFVSDY